MFREGLLTIDGETVLTMNQAAKLINFNVGRTKLMKLLRDWGLLLRTNEPAQYMINKGYMVYYLKTIEKVGVPLKKVPVTLVTINGLAFLKKFIYRKFNEVKNGTGS